MLRDLGYMVEAAKDAASAIPILEGGAHIDLLFTDVVMPGPVRSPELARKARELRPEIAVLFTSGYAESAIVHGGRAGPKRQSADQALQPASPRRPSTRRAESAGGGLTNFAEAVTGLPSPALSPTPHP